MWRGVRSCADDSPGPGGRLNGSPRDTRCRCGLFHVEQCKLHQQNAVSRRRFLFLGTAAAAAVIAAPYVELAAAPYEPFERIWLPTKTLMSRIVITGPMIEASRTTGPGAFVRAFEQETQRALKQLHDELQGRLVHG